MEKPEIALSSAVETARQLSDSLLSKIAEINKQWDVLDAEAKRLAKLKQELTDKAAALLDREETVKPIEDVCLLKQSVERLQKEAEQKFASAEQLAAEVLVIKKETEKERAGLQMALNDLEKAKSELARDWKQFNQQKADFKKRYANLKV